MVSAGLEEGFRAVVGLEGDGKNNKPTNCKFYKSVFYAFFAMFVLFITFDLIPEAFAQPVHCSGTNDLNS